jgi:hypothetical protein
MLWIREKSIAPARNLTPAIWPVAHSYTESRNQKRKDCGKKEDTAHTLSMNLTKLE